MSSNKQKPRAAISPARLKALNIAWHTPDRPLLAVRHSAGFLAWCGANGLTTCKKRVGRYLAWKAQAEQRARMERLRPKVVPSKKAEATS